MEDDKEHLAIHCATRCFECGDEQQADERGQNCFCRRDDGYLCSGRYVGLVVPRGAKAKAAREARLEG